MIGNNKRDSVGKKEKKLIGFDDDYDSFDVVEIISALCNDFFFIGNLIVSF